MQMRNSEKRKFQVANPSLSRLPEHTRKEERLRCGDVTANSLSLLATHISDSALNSTEAGELLRATAEAIRNEVRETI